MGSLDLAPSQPDRIRLHITPFTPDLYDRIIPPSLQPLATNRSFHTIQTFADRGYGFVELPAMEAQKLKKKLNGMTLKGTKMRVEEARPVRKRKSGREDETEESERKKAKKEKKERKQKEGGVLTGHELEEGRSVKRGWTGDESREGKKKRKVERKGEADTDGGERKLRFKAKVPPNKAPLEDAKEKKKKDKKAKKGADKGQVIVEEFTKRRRKEDHPVGGAEPGSTSYHEGKGWMDEDGNIVEPERRSKRRKKQPSVSPEAALPADSPLEDMTAGAAQEQPDDIAAFAQANGEAAESSAEPSSNSESESEAKAEAEAEAEDEAEDGDNDEVEAGTPSIAHPKAIHPLEALFKRPAAPPPVEAEHSRPDSSSSHTPNRVRPPPIDTSFSFFGGGGGDDVDDTEMAEDEGEDAGNVIPPVTPHTKQDLEWRSLRSAAPTPDTAAIGRKFSFPFAHPDADDDEEDDEDENDEDQVDSPRLGGEERTANGKGEERGEESAFRKWFFENRGDLNRGWKKRRREERKVKRQRENRRLGRKVA